MKGRQIKYSATELAWIKACSDMHRGEMHALFVAIFNRPELSLINLNSLCRRKGWMTGRTGCFAKGEVPHNKGKPMPYHPNRAATQFKKGNLPHNINYLGHERVSKDGYIEISVDEVNPYTGYERRYALKHRHLWILANGPVPDGHCLKCLDGDRTNTDPANWDAIPYALAPRLNGKFGRGYDDAPAEIKPTIMAIAKLEHAARNARAMCAPGMQEGV